MITNCLPGSVGVCPHSHSANVTNLHYDLVALRHLVATLDTAPLLCPSTPLCSSINAPTHPPTHPPTSASIHSSAHPTIRLPIIPLIHASVYPPVHPPMYTSIHLPSHSSVYLSVHSSVYLPSRPLFPSCLLHAKLCASCCVAVSCGGSLPSPYHLSCGLVWPGEQSEVSAVQWSPSPLSLGAGPTSPQPRFSAPPFLPVEWPGLLGVAVEGPRVGPSQQHLPWQ